MWPWASHESKSTIKGAIMPNMCMVLNDLTEHFHVQYLISLPHGLLWGVWQLLTSSIIESRNLRPRETESFVHSHISIKWQSQEQTYNMISVCCLSFFLYTTLLPSGVFKQRMTRTVLSNMVAVSHTW